VYLKKVTRFISTMYFKNVGEKIVFFPGQHDSMQVDLLLSVKLMFFADWTKTHKV
jgi:hypothetical protein